MKLVVVAARQEMIARLVDTVREAGLRPEGIDLDAFALVRALAPAADTSGEARVYCHLGGLTNLAVAIGPTCLFTRTLGTIVTADGAEPIERMAPPEEQAVAAPVPDPFRSLDETVELAEPDEAVNEAPVAPVVEIVEPGRSDPKDDADDVSSVEAAALAAFEAAATKREAPAAPMTQAAPPVARDAQVDALGEEIRLSIDFYMAQAEAVPATGIVLSGPGAHRDGIAERLQQAIGIPVELAVPLGSLDTGGVPPGDDEFRYTIAAGLAMGEHS